MGFVAGKGVKDPYEAQQIIVKRTKEVEKERTVFYWPVELNGAPRAGFDPALEGKKAVKINEDWIENKYGGDLLVDKEPSGKIYVTNQGGKSNGMPLPKEKIRIYEPEKVAELPDPDGRYYSVKE